MRFAFLCFIVVCGTYFVQAQEELFSFEDELVEVRLGDEAFSCGWSGESLLQSKSFEFKTNAEAEAVMSDIIGLVGLRPNFKIQAAKVPNAAAVVYGNERFVYFNPSFIQSVSESTNTNWAAISILAHEIGHHLQGHTLKEGGSRPDMELEADEFSGFVLRKMGASLEDAQIAMRKLASPFGSATHPGRDQRLRSIEQGWKRADEQVASYGQKTKIPTAPDTNSSNETQQKQEETNPAPNAKPVSHPAFAQYAVTLNNNPGKFYYITTRNSFVTLREGKVDILGHLAPTGNEKFPYKIVFDNTNIGDLLINRKGELYSTKGTVVGALSRV